MCVGGLLVRRRRVSQVLLGRRSPQRASYPGVWDAPGGHGEPGETPEQTLVRELQEELGVTPTAWRLLAEHHLPAGDRRPEALHLYLYVVTAWRGTPRNRQPAEHAEVAWLGLDDACALDLADPGYVALFRQLADFPV